MGKQSENLVTLWKISENFVFTNKNATNKSGQLHQKNNVSTVSFNGDTSSAVIGTSTVDSKCGLIEITKSYVTTTGGKVLPL